MSVVNAYLSEAGSMKMKKYRQSQEKYRQSQDKQQMSHFVAV